MKSSHVLLIAVAAFLAGQTFNGRGESVAHAQLQITTHPVGRFQLSAYGSQSGNGFYLDDTATGEVWYKQGELPLRHVSDPRLK